MAPASPPVLVWSDGVRIWAARGAEVQQVTDAGVSPDVTTVETALGLSALIGFQRFDTGSLSWEPHAIALFWPDAGARDAGTPDAGMVDAGTLDAGSSGAGTLDAGVDGGASVDAGADPGPVAFTSCGCGSGGELGALVLLSLLVLRRRPA